MLVGADRDTLVGVGLAVTAGFVDAAAFIALTGLFTAPVTGNFVLIGAESNPASSGVLAKLLALPVFILAVALTRLIALGLGRGSEPLRPLLALKVAILTAFATAGVILSPLGSPDGVKAISVDMLRVTAMGIQNGIGRLVIGHLTATTVMTVNVTQAVIDLIGRLCGAQPGGQASTRLWRTLSAVLAFAAGTLGGAFGVAALSFWCMLVPALILLRMPITPDQVSRP